MVVAAASVVVVNPARAVVVSACRLVEVKAFSSVAVRPEASRLVRLANWEVENALSVVVVSAAIWLDVSLAAFKAPS